MKVYLDDERPVPDGWIGCKTPSEAIELLKTGQVETISLDHDLGLVHINPEPTGYDVLIWLEREVFTNDFVPPRYIRIHTANAVAMQRMKLLVRRILLKGRPHDVSTYMG
jgi:hypothetical protein